MSRPGIEQGRSTAPRLWVGPDGTVIDCDDADRSHSLFVVENSGLFGISADLRDRMQAFWQDRDIEFDYDYVLALAEANGWARTSRDEGDGYGISAADGVAAKRAAKAMVATGFDPASIAIEIEWIRGHLLKSRSIQLAGEALLSWLEGAPPRGRWQTHERPIATLTEGFDPDAAFVSMHAMRAGPG